MKLSTNLTSLLKFFFDSLAKNNIKYAVLRNYEKLPYETSRDIDLYIDQKDYPKVFEILSKISDDHGVSIIKETSKFKYRKVILTDSSLAFDYFFQLDFFMNENLFGIDFFHSEEWETIKNPENNIHNPTKLLYLSSLLLTAVFHGDIKQRYINIINTEIRDNILLDKLQNLMIKKIGTKNTSSLLQEIANGNSVFLHLRLRSRLIFFIKQMLKSPFASILNFLYFIKGHISLLFKPPGKFIVFVGPDGSGKTSTIEEIKKRAIPELYTDSFYFHGQVSFLPELKKLKSFFKKDKNIFVKTKINKDEPIQSIKNVKLKYVYCTYYAINQLFLYPTLLILKWRNRIIIGDRYFYDYYYQNGFNWKSVRYLNFLTRCIPKPDITVVLRNNPDTIYKRKPEISVSEIERQIKLISQYKERFYNVQEITTNSSIEDISRQIIKKSSQI
jgi:thymidylate kinase